MSNSIQNLLKKEVGQPSKLFSQALTHGFPMALYRLPGENKIELIIDLRPELENSFTDLESLPEGFVVNPFSVHHPANPTLIKSDVKLSWTMEECDSADWSVNPALSGTQLDALLSRNESPQTPSYGNPGDVNGDLEDYRLIVAEAIQAMKDDKFAKVVLSRYEDTNLPAEFDLFEFFHEACQQYSNAFSYIVHTPALGTWCGATPESLLSQDSNNHFQTVSLAGTQKLEDKTLAEIAWTQKEIEEQAMVCRYIIDCFKKIRLREFEEIGPKTVRAGNLAHLKTEYKVDTTSIHVEGLATTMLHLLHPTSAVCGMPLIPALEFIKNREHYDRELYAGFLGPVNQDGNTHLFVNLRCMKLMDNGQVRFFAGAGITEDSNPDKEYIETQMKMNTLKNLMFA